jgi:hypothetical protein
MQDVKLGILSLEFCRSPRRGYYAVFRASVIHVSGLSSMAYNESFSCFCFDKIKEAYFCFLASLGTGFLKILDRVLT